MTREDQLLNRSEIIRMAREAGFCHDINNGIYLCASIHIERFAALVAAAEREACAKVCDDQSKEFGGVAKGPFVTDFGKHTQMSMAAGAENCAAAIRARVQI